MSTYLEIHDQIAAIGPGRTVYKPTAAEVIVELEKDLGLAGANSFVDLADGSPIIVSDNWADFAERWAAERERQNRPVHYIALALALRRAGFDVDGHWLFAGANELLQCYWERYAPSQDKAQARV